MILVYLRNTPYPAIAGLLTPHIPLTYFSLAPCVHPCTFGRFFFYFLSFFLRFFFFHLEILNDVLC